MSNLRNLPAGKIGTIAFTFCVACLVLDKAYLLIISHLRVLTCLRVVSAQLNSNI